MSTQVPRQSEGQAAAAGRPAGRRGSPWLRGFLWTAGSLVVLLCVLFLGFWYYTTTANFQRRAGAEVTGVLEDATGGKVEVGHLSFDLMHLAIEVDNLVIHGTEAPGQAPYISVARLLLRIQLNTFLAHGTGSGPRSHVGLNYLRAEQPHLHLIVDKNGNTNQPVPKHPSTSTEPVQDTLLDLQAGRVELVDGVALINDRAIPLNASADDLNTTIRYLTATDRYGATLDLNDLATRIAQQPEVHSNLHLAAELGRDQFALNSFTFNSGAGSHLTATALVEHFAKPEWQARVNGTLDLKQVGYLANLNGFQAGSADLDLNGRNCEVAPEVAQKHPRFWQRRAKKAAPTNAAGMLPPSPDCKAGYLLVGKVQVHRATYVLPSVRAVNVDAGAMLHVTPTELLFTALTGRLPGGGTIDGKLRIENWLGEVPQDAAAVSATTVAAAKTANTVAKGAGAAPVVPSVKLPSVQRAHAYLDVAVKAITLRTILDITGPQPFADLGLDTQVSGPVNAEWGGPAKDIASSVVVKADLHLTPTGRPRPGARQNIPVSGVVQATYSGATEIVDIANVELHTPATTLSGHGVLGVSTGDPLTNLAINLQSTDLGEFDSTLQNLGFANDGKRGSAALPVVLHGTLSFNGTARGAISRIDVKGHLTASDIEVKLGTQLDTQIDSVVADAEYSPIAGVAVGSSTIRRGTSILNASGTFAPRRVVSRHGGVTYLWDDAASLSANLTLAHGDVADLLQIAGQGNRIPVTGTADVQAHVTGTLRDLNGNGSIVFTNGVAYGEPYQRIAVLGTVAGQQIDASSISVTSNGQGITGSGAYNLATKHLVAHLVGNGIELAKVNAFKQALPDADATLSLNLNANGTVDAPNLQATADLTGLTYTGQELGEAHLNATSVGSSVNYSLHSTLLGAQVNATGTTSLTGNYGTDATVTLGNLDIAKPLAMFGESDLKGTSRIAGSIHVAGPAALPRQLVGTAVLTPLTVTLQGFTLAAAVPLEAGLRDGLLTLNQVHLTGQDTDVRLGGTVRVFGDPNPRGGELSLHSEGSVSMALAHTLDKDIISSGKATFDVGIGGRLKDPQPTGRVRFDNVNLALYGVPNGLTGLNGTLVFNQNRLDVEDLTAVTGGGQLKLGGSLIYQKGIFADLTAKGNNVRIRYNGLSTTANAQLQLQGTPQSLLLSGNVLITRFGIGPDVDFAAFAGPGGVSLPPDPDSASNKVRLDVHVMSAPQLDFQNSYAKLAGNVDLNIRGTVAVPSILGKIQITDGSATFAGTKYQLQRGTIYFTNPVRIDPIIDLDASARVENYDITISLHGTSTSLKPTYRSEPPLTEADIFNLLALGRTQEEAQLNSQQQTQAGTDPATSAILGGALNATVSSRVNKLFGAGSVKIDPAFVGTLGNSSARITVQEPITKQLTLVFATNVNQSAEQLIQLQYQISENKSLVITRDESGVFSIVYKIRKRYR